MLAVERGYVEMVKLLLEQEDIDVNIKHTKYQVTPLILAASMVNEKMVEKLLNMPGILVNEGSKRFGSDLCCTLLHFAAETGHTEVVKVLLEHEDIDVNPTTICIRHSPLHLAARFGHTRVVKA